MPKHEHTEIEALLDSFHTSSIQNRGLLFLFILSSIYLLITTASITDLMLLKNTPVSLPILNIKIQLVGFNMISPLLILFLHVNYLINLKQHSTLIRACLAKGLKNSDLYPFLGNLAVIDPASALLNWLTAVAMPIVSLLAIELRFLPYHHTSFSTPFGITPFGMTDIHATILVLDSLLLLLYWPMITLRRAELQSAVYFISKGNKSSLQSDFAQFLRHIRSLPRLLGYLIKVEPVLLITISIAVLHCVAFQSVPSKNAHMIFGLWPINKCKICNIDIEGISVTDSDIPTEVSSSLITSRWSDSLSKLEHIVGIDLSNRDLRNANFHRTKMPNAIFRNSDLTGANFSRAYLEGANFDGAKLHLTHMSFANISNSTFIGAEIFGTNLWKAIANGVIFDHSSIIGTHGSKGDFRASSFFNTAIIGSSFNDSFFAGSLFYWTKFHLFQDFSINDYSEGIIAAGITSSGPFPLRESNGLSSVTFEPLGNEEFEKVSAILFDLLKIDHSFSEFTVSDLIHYREVQKELNSKKTANGFLTITRNAHYKEIAELRKALSCQRATYAKSMLYQEREVTDDFLTYGIWTTGISEELGYDSAKYIEMVCPDVAEELKSTKFSYLFYLKRPFP